MALRLVEILLPADLKEAVRETLDEQSTRRAWQESLDDGQILVRIVLDAEDTGPLVDRFQDRFGNSEHFQLLILPVEAAVPREVEKSEKPAKGDEGEPAEVSSESRSGLSREELHHDIADMMKLNWVYVAAVILSSIVAAIGMLRDNVAAIIGAMVIAPLLGPNVALAFASTIGDTDMIRRAFLTNIVGLSVSLTLAIVCGMIMTVDPAGPEIASRTQVQISDVVLALASGTAGALALTTGVPAALVGVMVAVALLPPAIAVGLMVGSGQWSAAMGASILLATNVICVNLAGIVTFLVQGIRPRTWWEAERAKRMARIALVIWIGVLSVLVALILLYQKLD